MSERQRPNSTPPDKPLTRRMVEIIRERVEFLAGFPEDKPVFGPRENALTIAEARELLKEWDQP